ncbi:MAG: winged helix-turn-helix domain-containing protein, partial [Campylobacterales bacterium]|nr:winged helix-turn-helix domain-containing protein [Campylobacterales bacterium]
PKLDGIEAGKIIKKESKKTKIIFLTAYSDTKKLLSAIRVQASDFLIKPVSRSELKNALDKTISIIKKENKDNRLIIDFNLQISIDIENGLIYKKGQLIDMTKSEVDLLKFFCKYQNQIVSKIDIFNYVWDDLEKEFSDVSVRNLVMNLRKKIPEGLIENIYGGGYIFKI